MDKEFLIHQYVELGKSIKAIGREFDVNSGLVSHYLKKYGIPARPATTNPNFDFSRLLEDGMLFDLYVTKQMSVKQVAEHFGCVNGPVLRALKLLDIHTRPKHVVLRNALKGKDHSGAKSATWKGGKSKCSVCGVDLNHWKKDAKCWPCERESRKHKPRLPPEQCKTDESKLWRRRTEFKDWRKAVFDRDQYKCRICGEHTRNLVPHHLDGFAEHVEKRFDTNNGVTLCTEHHIEFHRNYGFGGNTSAQVQQYTLHA